MVNLNLNGGPSKKAAQLSSLPVARRYGRLCLMSTLLMTLLWPVISPTEEPLSHRKTAPNLHPTRGGTGGERSGLAGPWDGQLCRWRPGAGMLAGAAPLTAVFHTRSRKNQHTGTPGPSETQES